ncbi:MAG: phosphotransferase [Myxococcota bacterium]
MSAQRRLSDESLGDHLRRLGIAAPGDRVEVEPAGDGNINWVRRATLIGAERRSCIVKQARPALERFPEYEAPTERMLCEARYLERARGSDEDGVLPAVLAFDAPNRLIVLEDLGAAERLDVALARRADVGAALTRLAAFLGRVHAGTRDDGSLVAEFANEGMQRLHGDHIFVLPFIENDFALPPRTAERGATLREDTAFRETAARAYARYLEPRGALVHGDVQAGNVLLPPGGVKLLDAEIAHVGDPAFDLGTLLAHRLLPDAARGAAAEARPALAACWDAYRGAHGEAGLPALEDALRYAGLELLRRTLGAARVAAVTDDEAGLRVIEVGAALVREASLASV